MKNAGFLSFHFQLESLVQHMFSINSAVSLCKRKHLPTWYIIFEQIRCDFEQGTTPEANHSISTDSNLRTSINLSVRQFKFNYNAIQITIVAIDMDKSGFDQYQFGSFARSTASCAQHMIGRACSRLCEGVLSCKVNGIENIKKHPICISLKNR